VWRSRSSRDAAIASSPPRASFGRRPTCASLGAAEIIDRNTLSQTRQASSERALGRRGSIRSAATRSPTRARRRLPKAWWPRAGSRRGWIFRDGGALHPARNTLRGINSVYAVRESVPRAWELLSRELDPRRWNR